MKKEFVFQIEQDEAMLVAICHEPEMATQGENLDELPAMIRDLIRCRFGEGDEHLDWPIRLHFLHDPVVAVTDAIDLHPRSARVLDANGAGAALLQPQTAWRGA